MLGREPRRSNLQPDFRRFSLIRPNRSRPFSRVELVQVKRGKRRGFPPEFTPTEHNKPLLERFFEATRTPVLTLRVDCSLFGLKAAHFSRYLPLACKFWW